MKKIISLLIAILVLISCLVACDFDVKDIFHKHTFEYLQYETGHYKQYTCGCPSPDILGEHCDNDGDFFCDVCGYNIYPLIPPDIAPEYSLTMNDEEWLYEDLESTYKAGETVSVKIRIAYDLGYLFFVNGERIMPEEHSGEPYWKFIFTMPESDVVIDFKTYDGFLPDANIGVLIEAFWTNNLDADYVSIRHYYGEYASGAIVAMIDSAYYTEALWDEAVGDTVIHYCDGNRIIVLYDGEFYTLPKAYANGYLTAEDLTVINEKHKEFNPYLYE